MENKNDLKYLAIGVIILVLALSALILAGLISDIVSQDVSQDATENLEGANMPVTTTTVEEYIEQTTTLALTPSTTTTTIKNLGVTDGPRPVYKGDLENNPGRFFINKTVIFNDSSGVKRVAGVVRQIHEIDEEDIENYDGEEVYIQYWNGTWAIYRRN